jgi:flagellar basal-body rod protein FlgF
MDRLAFNAVASLNEQRVSRQMSVNEMANVSTIGFKRSFEVATRAVQVEGAGFKTRFQPQSFSEDCISLKPGPLIATGNELDIALSGSTVLGVSAADGKLAFTRRGDLRINAQGTLENGQGHLIRSEGGGPLTLPPGLKIEIRADGTVMGTDMAQVGVKTPVALGKLMLRDASTSPLLRRQDGLFKNSAGDGQDITPGPQKPGLTPGALEGSSVNAMNIMVKLIDQSRAFEQQINMIKEAKTTDEAGASMLKGS